MKIGLLLGTFNPLHNSHLSMANFCLNEYDLDQIWFVVARNNPFKVAKNGLPFELRVEMASLAVDDERFKVCDIEKYIEEPPFYTTKTLGLLIQHYPDYEFSIIMGIDNWLCFDSWHNYSYLFNFRIIVLGRGNTTDQIEFIKAKEKFQTINWDKRIDIFNHVRFSNRYPSSSLSSTFIREEIEKKHSIYGYVPEKIINYIKQNNIYG